MEAVSAFADRTFKTYYDDLGKHAVLTPKEERALLERYNTCPNCSERIPHKVKREYCTECGASAPGDTDYRLTLCTQCNEKFETYHAPAYCLKCGKGRDLEARECIINGNLRFVVRMAKSITKDPYRIQQLTSAGNVGLLIAIDKFDISQGTRFLTYAAHWIRKEMFDEIQSSSLVHVPSHKQKSHRKTQKNGVFVCRHCDLRIEGDQSPSRLPKCTSQESHEFLPTDDVESLNVTIPLDARGMSLTLSEDTDTEEDVIDASVAELIRDVLSKIKMRERDKFILLQYYDIAEKSRRLSSKSLHQLAVLADITPERVRQIKERLLKEVKLELRRMSITELGDLCSV
jgi:RNA polymerase primary sigma factor